jgi:hypothetical protein
MLVTGRLLQAAMTLLLHHSIDIAAMSINIIS